MKTLVIANHKGGVGKSAVATLLAHHLAQQGRRVLAIDLDHQGNFSSPLSRSGRVTKHPLTSTGLLTDRTTGCPSEPFVLVAADTALDALERQQALHSQFARNLRAFLNAVDGAFDVCLIDTHPNPDIRLIAALVNADFVLSPIQLNQEAIEGVHALLNHPRAGLRKLKTVLNPKLQLIGLLPNLVEQTPFQRANFMQLIERYYPLLIPIEGEARRFASIPKRSAIAEAQAEGALLQELKKSAAREAAVEIAPTLRTLASRVTTEQVQEAASHGAAA